MIRNFLFRWLSSILGFGLILFILGFFVFGGMYMEWVVYKNSFTCYQQNFKKDI